MHLELQGGIFEVKMFPGKKTRFKHTAFKISQERKIILGVWDSYIISMHCLVGLWTEALKRSSWVWVKLP